VSHICQRFHQTNNKGRNSFNICKIQLCWPKVYWVREKHYWKCGCLENFCSFSPSTLVVSRVKTLYISSQPIEASWWIGNEEVGNLNMWLFLTPTYGSRDRASTVNLLTVSMCWTQFWSITRVKLHHSPIQVAKWIHKQKSGISKIWLVPTPYKQVTWYCTSTMVHNSYCHIAKSSQIVNIITHNQTELNSTTCVQL